MSEFGLCPIAQISFKLLPGAGIRANLFTPGADWDHASESFDLVDQMFKVLNKDGLRLLGLSALREDTG